MLIRVILASGIYLALLCDVTCTCGDVILWYNNLPKLSDFTLLAEKFFHKFVVC